MSLYFQKQFRSIFALFFAIMALILALQQMKIELPINGNFILVVNGMLFALALFNFKRMHQVDINNPSVMIRSVMVGILLKFILFGGAALWYATKKSAPIGTINLLVAMGVYSMYTFIEISWTKRKKDA